MFPVKYSSICPSGFRGENFFQAIRNRNHPWCPFFVQLRQNKEISYRTLYQILIQSKHFQRKRFFYVSANQTQELSMAVMFLSNLNKMSKLCNRPCIDDSCKINVTFWQEISVEMLFVVLANKKQELSMAAIFV